MNGRQAEHDGRVRSTPSPRRARLALPGLAALLALSACGDARDRLIGRYHVTRTRYITLQGSPDTVRDMQQSLFTVEVDPDLSDSLLLGAESPCPLGGQLQDDSSFVLHPRACPLAKDQDCTIQSTITQGTGSKSDTVGAPLIINFQVTFTQTCGSASVSGTSSDQIIGQLEPMP